MEGKITVIYSTFPNPEIIKEISNQLIDKKLVACSNSHAIKSCYFWNGEIQNDNEWVGLFKTIDVKKEVASKFLEENHPYDTPCILSWEVKANTKYYEWIKSQVV